MNDIKNMIMSIDKNICENIDLLSTKSREFVSVNILNNLRNFVEHLNFLLYVDDCKLEIEHTWDNIQSANKYIYAKGSVYRTFRDLHFYLQASISHYSPLDDASERLMLKYFEYLVRIKKYFLDRYGMQILKNIMKFPISLDTTFNEYYDDIYRLVKLIGINTKSRTVDGKYYIMKKKSIFVNGDFIYELTLTPASDHTSKFDRIIAYTMIDIMPNYSVRVSIKKAEIEIFGKVNTISIVDNYFASIRGCEFNNLFKLLNLNNKIETNYREYVRMMQYLTYTSNNLLDLVLMDVTYYNRCKSNIISGLRATYIFDMLDFCRTIIQKSWFGSNIVRFILFSMNNVIIKDQTDVENETCFSPLNITNKSFPFEKNPFMSSLSKHNLRIKDVVSCISILGREHELFGRRIINNTERERQLYTPIKSLDNVSDINKIVRRHNSEFNDQYNSRKITLTDKYVYINSYESNTISILEDLLEYTKSGLEGYSKSFKSWIKNNPSQFDSVEKQAVMESLFNDTSVALVYGAAGTGKSTLMNYISKLFLMEKKLFMAKTHPALSNLKGKVGEARNHSFKTIASFSHTRDVDSYDVVFIDECSTISNLEMVMVLKKLNCDLLVLTGDVYQIESIRFGNWFNIAKEILPQSAINELLEPHRTKNRDLLELWAKVRNNDNKLVEFINKNSYSKPLNEKLLEVTSNDEIILCLNYDGLYGINNINRYLQNNNPNKAVEWELLTFKINDPIIFNDSQRFSPLIYNNMKGKIINITKGVMKITFDIELDIAINKLHAKRYDFTLVESEGKYSIIRFDVHRKNSSDNDDANKDSVLPFQIAYAVSIHKSQGLEYESVKVIFTKEIEELISHNLFYTAITRTTNQLKIYWTPECENFITTHMKVVNSKRDANIIKSKISRN